MRRTFQSTQNQNNLFEFMEISSGSWLRTSQRKGRSMFSYLTHLLARCPLVVKPFEVAFLAKVSRKYEIFSRLD